MSEPKNKICEAVKTKKLIIKNSRSGQLGGGEGCCALVWSVSTQRLLYRCGLGFFERQVQAVSFAGCNEEGGSSKYLIAIGGDNSQTIGIFDLKGSGGGGNDVNLGEVASPVLMGSVGMAPGVPPSVATISWRPSKKRGSSDDNKFVTMSEGKNLKYWR